ncbi:MAG TPA: GrpB family protein [bacterium]|nr:GrpB family protein [bacterium]
MRPHASRHWRLSAASMSGSTQCTFQSVDTFGNLRSRAREHHLHMVERTTDFWLTHVLFRDLLRAHPDVVEEYAALKHTLAARYGSDGFGYTNAKSDFIVAVLERAEQEARTRWRSTLGARLSDAIP